MKRTKFAILSATILVLTIYQASAQSFSTILKRPDNVLEPKWEINSRGNQELNYYNQDFCDYYLYRGYDQSCNLHPGKNTIFTIVKGSQSVNPFKNTTTSYSFRGIFPKNFKIETPYALPIRDGAMVTWKTNVREHIKSINFLLVEGDTVYATRSGIACTTFDPRQLLVYHSDCSFAAYLTMNENFIEPGENVLTGQPIGLAGSTGVAISYFFLDKDKFKLFQPNSYPYLHFTPVFRTTQGDVKLERNKSYQAIVDDALIMQDMSKREQKKYLKRK